MCLAQGCQSHFRLRATFYLLQCQTSWTKKKKNITHQQFLSNVFIFWYLPESMAYNIEGQNQYNIVGENQHSLQNILQIKVKMIA